MGYFCIGKNIPLNMRIPTRILFLALISAMSQSLLDAQEVSSPPGGAGRTVSVPDSGPGRQEAWTLRDCISYAMDHNIQLRKLSAQHDQAAVDVREARAALLPSLSGQMAQAGQYRPFQESAGSFVNAGMASSASHKVTQSGSYGINAAWTLWDGGQKRLTIKGNELTVEQAAQQMMEQANSIQEQIAKLFVQILYMQEAVKVNRTLLAQDSTLWRRGQAFLEQGQMAKADVAQLAAQVSQGRYDVVNVETQIATLKMQLRQLLELPVQEQMAIAAAPATETGVLSELPALQTVYDYAARHRPEMQRSALSVEQSRLATKLARASRLPSVSMTGGIGDSHMTGSQHDFFNQMKTNFNAQLGVSLSIPILDQRKSKSAVERAQVGELTARLDMQDARRTLYTQVESYYLEAVNSRAKYLAARENVNSLQTSYEMMSEKFSLGDKNIADLLSNRRQLLNARQDLLQDKYTTLLNRALLCFYGGQELEL